MNGIPALPFDSKSCDSGLLSKHIPPNLLNDWFGGGFGAQYLVIVFIVDVVTNAHELSSIV